MPPTTTFLKTVGDALPPAFDELVSSLRLAFQNKRVFLKLMLEKGAHHRWTGVALMGGFL